MVMKKILTRGGYSSCNIMDEKKYCVFWFPSIYHTPINERFRRFEVETPITDFGSDVATLKVSIDYPHNKNTLTKDMEVARKDQTLIEKKLCFEVFKRGEAGNNRLFKIFELKHVNHSNNGMVVYSYEEPNDYPKGDGKPTFEKALTTIFYHCAKSLFHNHEVQTDRDSGLVAYIPDLTKFNPQNSIHEKDNEAIKFFLEQFETIFLDYAERASGFIRNRDALLAKFEGKISLSKDDNYLSGYKALTQYGWKDFRKWYEDPIHKPDVVRCKKDILSWQLIVKPAYKKRKKKREHYINRHNKIAEALIPILKENSTDDAIKDLVLKYNTVGETLKEWGDVSWRKMRRKDIFPVNKMLQICEIGLGINNSFLTRRRLYKKLKNYYLDLSVLTEQTRRKIGMLCEGALTEYVYCKTLLESKYNTYVSHKKPEPNEQEDLEHDKWRKKACNIRNAIRYIETVRYRCSNAQTHGVHTTLKKADKLSQNAKIWTFVGIFLSFVGLALTAIGVVLTVNCNCQ